MKAPLLAPPSALEAENFQLCVQSGRRRMKASLVRRRDSGLRRVSWSVISANVAGEAEGKRGR